MKTILISLLFLLLYCTVSAQNDKTYDHVKLNQIQVIGSHNSYKQSMDTAIFQMLQQTDTALAQGLDYSHISLADQLSMGLHNLEIDVYADTQGGKYAHPKGLDWASQQGGAAPYDPEGVMQKPGFKVLHVQDIDFRSNCLTFQQCLQELKSWSEAHPDHRPVFVTMNAKDEAINKPGFTVPEKFTAEVLDRLDQSIQENMGKERLMTPDQVRGRFKTLERAVLQGNWPTLADARGKFMFVLDEIGDKRAAYIHNHPSLKGRIMFANAAPGTPEAAFLIMNDPVSDLQKIQEMVEKGYIVRTRADANTQEARHHDKSKFEAACQSGAQIITTDYYQKSTHFPSDYVIHFEDGGYFRLNPLNKPRQP